MLSSLNNFQLDALNRKPAQWALWAKPLSANWQWCVYGAAGRIIIHQKKSVCRRIIASHANNATGKYLRALLCTYRTQTRRNSLAAHSAHLLICAACHEFVLVNIIISRLIICIFMCVRRATLHRAAQHGIPWIFYFEPYINIDACSFTSPPTWNRNIYISAGVDYI